MPLLAWCSAIALVDALTAEDAVLLGLLITGPLIAAWRASTAVTVVVGFYAVVLAIVLGVPDNIFLSVDHVVRVTIVAVGSILAVLLARTLERLESAQFRHSLVADAGEVLSSALDYEVTLIGLARLCAHRIADWCFVFVKQDDGSVRQVAAAHADPERQRQAWELLFRFPLEPSRPEGPAKVIRTGEPELVPVVTDPVLRAIAPGDENLQMLKALGIRSAMIVPLSVREQTLGALAFASAESGRVYGPEDLALAEELGSRAAVAVDNARLYGRLHETQAELRVSRDQLEAILNGVADAVTVQRADGRVVYANDAAARSLGYASSEEMTLASPSSFVDRYELYDEEGNQLSFDSLPGRLALMGEDPEPALVRYRDREARTDMWSLIKATTIRDRDGTPLLAVNVIEDVTAQREREQQLRFLAEAGRILGGSLDWEETFPELARLVTRTVADWCVIQVFDDDATPRVAAFAHRDERVEAALRDLQDARRLLEVAPADSTLTVPMVARGRALGSISLVSGDQGRRLDENDQLLGEEVASRCALALDNARLFRERSRIARTLQESLLPPMLPDLPGLDLAARFRAAGAGLDVGGDFYDLFETGDSGWAVAIGDVCGKGSEAAAITALARYTVRTAAMRQDAPSQILSLLNEALLRQRTDRRFCTVLYGRLERNGVGHRFDFASGGHPLPLVLRASSGGGEVGVPGTLLGIVPDPELNDDRVVLGPGDALVLYTDGVTDSHAPAHITTATELAAAVGSPAALDADSIAERVMQTALASGDNEPRDDIAILVLKVPEQA